MCRLFKDQGKILALLFSVPFSVHASTDYYTTGFFTRGAESAYYLDSGDSVYDPFYVPLERWAFIPRMTLTASYEDNLFLSADKSDGSIIHFIPGAALILGRPEAQHLYVDYGMIIPLYDSSDRLDEKPSHMLTLGGAYITAKSQVYGRAGYRRLENVDTLVGARIVKEDYLVNLALDHRISQKSTVGALGNYEIHEFQDAQFIDYTRTYGAVRVFHDVSPKSQGFIQAGLGQDDLDTGANGFGDADFYDLSLGVRGKPTPKTSASGRVGYMWRMFDDRELEDLEGWIASLYGEATPFGFTTFSAELFSDLRPAVQSAGSTALDRRVTLSLARRMWTERLRGQASVFWGQTEYRGPEENPRDNDGQFVFDRREDDYWGYTLGVDWWTRHHVSCGLAYSYIDKKGARGTNEDAQRASSFESGRWTLRMSWNY